MRGYVVRLRMQILQKTDILENKISGSKCSYITFNACDYIALSKESVLIILIIRCCCGESNIKYVVNYVSS